MRMSEKSLIEKVESGMLKTKINNANAEKS